MASSIKASQFNPQTMANARVPRRRIKNGVPVTAQSRGPAINNMIKVLSKNNCMPQDAATEDVSYTAAAEACLSALSITVSQITSEESVKTFNTAKKNSQNEADEKNESQRKNYTDDTFPNQDDPYYQMDQAPPRHVNRARAVSQKNAVDNRAIVDLVTNISLINEKLPSSNRLKQLVEVR